MFNFQSNAVIQYPDGRLQTLTHRAPWYWIARLIRFSYEYGTLLMPLAGGAHVIDTYITEVKHDR